jgi:hypothetical protein
MTLTQCSLDELDLRARRAERDMNLALEARRWNLVQRHRAHMRAALDERERRASELDETTESTADSTA